jgi:hypothetical protein
MQHSRLTENFLIIQSYGGAFLFKLQIPAGGGDQEKKEEGGDNGEFSLSSLSSCPRHLPLGMN